MFQSDLFSSRPLEETRFQILRSFVELKLQALLPDTTVWLNTPKVVFVNKTPREACLKHWDIVQAWMMEIRLHMDEVGRHLLE